MHAELTWWYTLLSDTEWHGLNVVVPESQAREIHLWTDAASTKRIGGFYIEGCWHSSKDGSSLMPNPSTIPLSQAFSSKPSLKLRKSKADSHIHSNSTATPGSTSHINLLELYAIFHALTLWGSQHFRNTILHIHCDNTTVIGWLLRRSTRSSNIKTLNLLRKFLARCSALNISLRCHCFFLSYPRIERYQTTKSLVESGSLNWRSLSNSTYSLALSLASHSRSLSHWTLFLSRFLHGTTA
ncbi:hypothetical protein BJ508DRAFT_132481 [Ascobolus immersus RN42]|uniref:Uncharacterized protein n=1 Tax=Ascobolus immersus RN42 TaxID=1160509 RepID=A0A3N4I1F4_ASCIM|nr:hypothetical protein BJ508DRAFT_132481 [Ascobolus immersus RN42]